MHSVKLQIGGRSKMEGWLSLGAESQAPVDQIPDYGDLKQFADNSVQVIYAPHILQLLSFASDLQAALREWFRALKPGGELIVTAPDLELLCRYFVSEGVPKEARFELMRMMFGGHSDPDDFFVSGFDFDILHSHMFEAGFRAIRRVEKLDLVGASTEPRLPLPTSLNIRAYKPPVPEGVDLHSFAPPRTAVVQRELEMDRVMRHLSQTIECKTIVDLGCADGHFALENYEMFRRPKIINVDANPFYEASLRAIADVTEGAYVIAAMTDQDGEIEITEGAHPYWSSVQPPSDPYWKSVNNLVTGKRRVRAMTLDTLEQECSLSPPYLLKLDIQGAEAAALKGGQAFLRNTSAVLCEVITHDFSKIHRALEDADFALFDIMSEYRDDSGCLAYFYPIYLPQRHPALQTKGMWRPELDAETIRLQENRRRRVLSVNEKVLGQLRQERLRERSKS